MPDEVAHGPHVRRAVKKEITVARAQHAFTVQAMAGAVAIAQADNLTALALRCQRTLFIFAKRARRIAVVERRQGRLVNISQPVLFCRLMTVSRLNDT